MFYTYWQNNSGGYYVTDDNIGENTIIEADTPGDANRIAEGIGMWFDGVASGRDCACCGNRWGRMRRGYTGDPVPSMYGEPVDLDNVPNTIKIHWKNPPVSDDRTQAIALLKAASEYLDKMYAASEDYDIDCALEDIRHDLGLIVDNVTNLEAYAERFCD